MRRSALAALVLLSGCTLWDQTTFQPSPEDREVMGGDTMAEGRDAAVVEQVHATTLRRVARADIARRLAPIIG